MICLERGRGESVLIRVFVQPRASANRIIGIHGKALKLRITAPPVDGKANRMVVNFLAKLFKVSKSSIEVIGGKNSRNKAVKITGMKISDIEDVLLQQIKSEVKR